MKKTVKKVVKKSVTKSVKKYVMPKISKTMATETVLARMIDIEDRGDRVAVLVEYLKGADRAFGSAVLQRMTRESCALTLEASGAVYKPASVPAKVIVAAPAPLPLTLDSAVAGVSHIASLDAEITSANKDIASVTADVVLGPYSSSWAAEQDVKQLMHPKVMQYRSTVFPPPSTHAVTATVLTAESIKLTDHPALMPKQRTLAAAYPYAIKLQVQCVGAPKKVDGWMKAFERANHFTKVG